MSMTMKDVMEETVSKELSFLASLYSGWNATQMTTDQFEEALEKLKQRSSVTPILVCSAINCTV